MPHDSESVYAFYSCSSWTHFHDDDEVDGEGFLAKYYAISARDFLRNITKQMKNDVVLFILLTY